MKKIYAIFLLLLLIFLIYIVQMFVLNEIKLFGTIANLILVTVVMVALWYSLPVACIFSAVLGSITDMIFYFSIGRCLVIYLVIAVLINLISKVYRKENNVVIMYVVAIGTITFEILMAITSLGFGVFPGVFDFILMIIKAIVLNIGLAYIVNKLFAKFTINISNKLDLYIER